MDDILYIVVPCYNEEEVIQSSVNILINKMQSMVSDGIISSESRLLLVDDGSIDLTWEIALKLIEEHAEIIGVKLSHNQGHQNALLAGMMYAKNKCDCLISIDADLQDDIEVLPRFIEKFNSGCHVVYGVRSERKTDSLFKRITAQLFYKFMNVMGAERFTIMLTIVY